MPKKFHLGKSSDMRKFQKTLENNMMDIARKSIENRKYETICPHCQAKIFVSSGKNLCPSCKNEIDVNLKLDIH